MSSKDRGNSGKKNGAKRSPTEKVAEMMKRREKRREKDVETGSCQTDYEVQNLQH